jgi:uncharacterized protein
MLRLALESMIIETIFSTIDLNKNPNFAPMGVLWHEDSLIVRPFRSTDTFKNLLATGYGIANLTDDVLAYVRCALYDAVLPHFPAAVVPGVILRSACAWRELEIISWNGDDVRAELGCRVLHKGRQRDFLGFRRGGNAVIEAAILATRLPFFDRSVVLERLTGYGEIVARTGNEDEKQAFQLIQEYVRQRGN